MSDRPTLWVHYDYGPDGEFSDRRASRADLLAALPDAGLTAWRFCAVHGAVYYEKGSTWCKLHRVYYDNGVMVPSDCVPTTMWLEAADERQPDPVGDTTPTSPSYEMKD